MSRGDAIGGDRFIEGLSVPEETNEMLAGTHISGVLIEADKDGYVSLGPHERVFAAEINWQNLPVPAPPEAQELPR